MRISEISVKRPVFATMMIGALLVLGMFSYLELSVDMFPDIDFPITIVQTVYPGAAAETVETEVSKKIEDVINEISGIRHITSRSREGYSLIIVEFDLYKDGFEATQEVREKLGTIRGELPDDIEEPLVQNYDPDAMPVISMAISGQRTAREVTELTRNTIKKRLETIPGVGNVTMVGGKEREILIALDPVRMESYQVTVQDVSQAVAAANLEIPGGRIDEQSREYLVRMSGRLPRVKLFEDIIVKNVGGVQVYLKDIATVADTIKELRSFSSYDGKAAVSLTINKQSGANTVEMASLVKEGVNRLEQELPGDIDIEIVRDHSTFIEDSIHEILFNIRFGTLLAVLVIFLFLLDLRPTIISGLSIPISIIAAFTIMNMFNFTINVMTLLGLSLAVGILIDDAIVVIENIYRHIDQGKSAFQAAISGTKEIGLAVMATTFSIMVVFLPVAFMEGIIGRFFFEFGITVAFAVLISLFVAFTLTPMLSSRWLHKGDSRSPAPRPGLLKRFWLKIVGVLSVWNRVFETMKPRYRTLLAGALGKRWLVVVVATASFAAAIGIMMSGLVGMEFLAETDENRMIVRIDTPPGTNLEDTIERFREVESVVRQLPQVSHTFITIGVGTDPVTKGEIMVKLIDQSQRELSARQIMDSTRLMLTHIPGIEYAISRGEGEGGGEKPIEISLRGPNLDELTRLAHQVERIFYESPGTVDVGNTLEEGQPEIQVNVDRRLADDLGLDLYEISTTVRTLVEGEVVTKFKDEDEEYDVRLRLDEAHRSSDEDLERIFIKSDKPPVNGNELLVPLGRIASTEKSTEIGRYNRYDRQREVRVNANVASWAFAGTVTGEIMEKVSAIPLAPGYSIQPVGEQEIMQESFRNIFKALILAVIFIYLLLASQYESFFDPFSIMLSLPLSLVGAIVALIGSSFSIMSLIGIVLLMGLVTKNAILLIDFVKQERAKGVSRTEAVLTAGPIRLRPILMTTLATVFGMLPLALGIGPGAELRAPMARAAIGGMLSSTLLTLVVVPVVYTMIDDFVGLFRRGKKRKEEPVREETVVRG